MAALSLHAAAPGEEAALAGEQQAVLTTTANPLNTFPHTTDIHSLQVIYITAGKLVKEDFLRIRGPTENTRTRVWLDTDYSTCKSNKDCR